MHEHTDSVHLQISLLDASSQILDCIIQVFDSLWIFWRDYLLELHVSET